jgi:hypothetical protein
MLHDIILNWKTFCVRPRLVEEQLRLDISLALLIKTRYVYVSYFSFFKKYFSSFFRILGKCPCVATGEQLYMYR